MTDHICRLRTGTSAAGGRRYSVLVVEDEPALRTTVLQFLTADDLIVHMAVDGYEAIRILSGTDIDLLFTDIILPGGLSGFELARQAKLIRPALRVLYGTGFAAEYGNVDTGPRYGRMLYKPYRRQQVVDAVRTAFAA